METRIKTHCSDNPTASLCSVIPSSTYCTTTIYRVVSLCHDKVQSVCYIQQFLLNSDGLLWTLRRESRKRTAKTQCPSKGMHTCTWNIRCLNRLTASLQSRGTICLCCHWIMAVPNSPDSAGNRLPSGFKLLNRAGPGTIRLIMFRLKTLNGARLYAPSKVKQFKHWRSWRSLRRESCLITLQ